MGPSNAAWLELDLLGDSAVPLNEHLVDLEGRLDGIGLIVNPSELLKGTSLGFDTICQLRPSDPDWKTHPKKYHAADSMTSHPTKT